MATGLFNLKQVNQAISQGAWSGYIAPKWVEYLVVAGGGAGGGYAGGGGGGAGGLLTGIVTVAAGTSYTVTVGAGGVGRPPIGTTIGAAPSGSSSSFSAISATGGGGGGDYFSAGASGGSGGGGGATGGSGPAYIGGASVVNQGNYAGSSVVASTLYVAGGGGGAGTNGLNAVTAVGGNGGAGIASSITGVLNTYAGGGGGGTGYRSANSSTSSSGGVGGGGAGGNTTSLNGTSGSNNTGGGGGGSGFSSGSIDGSSGSGGSGIVVIRYPGNVQFYTGGAITYANGYIVHTFVASGTLAPTTPTVVTADYQISRSLRFNSADSAYLNRTPASAGNRQIWTISFWVKRTTLSTRQEFLGNADSSALNGLYVEFLSDDTLQIGEYGTSSWNWQFQTYPVYRDPSAWYHIVISVDTTQATNTNRVKIYVNNTQITVFNNTVYPSLNFNCAWNTTQPSSIGRNGAYAGLYGNAYLTEIYNIDGQALTPSSFGATNANTGVWGPVAYTGTYGTNGFYLNFSDNSNTTAATLGKDYSGNGNNWTPNNFSVTAGAGNDSLVDSPTNYGTDYGVGGAVRGNYSTLNPLFNATTLTNGNLDTSLSSASVTGTFGSSTGKWYFECTITAAPGVAYLGIADQTLFKSDGSFSYSQVYVYLSTSYKGGNGGSAVYGSTYTTNDVIGVAYDLDVGSITFYKNGTSQGVAFNTGFTAGYIWRPFLYFSNGSATFNFGQRAWAYTPPNGFIALTTQNLPASTIGSSPTTLATQYFNPVLYTGTGATNSITGVGFQPDWVWIKARSSAYSHRLADSVRGAGKELFSNETVAETTNSANGYVSSFNSDGFSLTSGVGVNGSATTFVAWNWKANGSGSTNTAGSITSTVSANTTSGFSIVTYTTTGTASTVGHGLGATPSMIITKQRNGTTAWYTYHTSIGATNYLLLNSTAASASSSVIWNNTSPTSTVFSLGSGFGSGETYVAYCFAEVAGYSKFGSYTGNGSTNGPFVFTGFRPAFVMFKKSDSGSESWVIVDTTRNTSNVMNNLLLPNTSDAEVTATYIDAVSNGFKIRETYSSQNASGGTYIYMAFATSPFKYSLAR